MTLNELADRANWLEQELAAAQAEVVELRRVLTKIQRSREMELWDGHDDMIKAALAAPSSAQPLLERLVPMPSTSRVK